MKTETMTTKIMIKIDVQNNDRNGDDNNMIMKGGKNMVIKRFQPQ